MVTQDLESVVELTSVSVADLEDIQEWADTVVLVDTQEWVESAVTLESVEASVSVVESADTLAWAELAVASVDTQEWAESVALAATLVWVELVSAVASESVDTLGSGELVVSAAVWVDTLELVSVVELILESAAALELVIQGWAEESATQELVVVSAVELVTLEWVAELVTQELVVVSTVQVLESAVALVLVVRV
jgi:hypothetical protein